MTNAEAIRGCTARCSPTFTLQEAEQRQRRPTIDPSAMARIRERAADVELSPGENGTILDIRSCGFTLSEMMAFISEVQSRFPNHEVFMDGDAYAIVGRWRRVSA